jgi:hypothetical protein
MADCPPHSPPDFLQIVRLIFQSMLRNTHRQLHSDDISQSVPRIWLLPMPTTFHYGKRIRFESKIHNICPGLPHSSRSGQQA